MLRALLKYICIVAVSAAVLPHAPARAQDRVVIAGGAD